MGTPNAVAASTVTESYGASRYKPVAAIGTVKDVGLMKTKNNGVYDLDNYHGNGAARAENMGMIAKVRGVELNQVDGLFAEMFGPIPAGLVSLTLQSTTKISGKAQWIVFGSIWAALTAIGFLNTPQMHKKLGLD